MNLDPPHSDKQSTLATPPATIIATVSRDDSSKAGKVAPTATRVFARTRQRINPLRDARTQPSIVSTPLIALIRSLWNIGKKKALPTNGNSVHSDTLCEADDNTVYSYALCEADDATIRTSHISSKGHGSGDIDLRPCDQQSTPPHLYGYQPASSKSPQSLITDVNGLKLRPTNASDQWATVFDLED